MDSVDNLIADKQILLRYSSISGINKNTSFLFTKKNDFVKYLKLIDKVIKHIDKIL